MFKYLMIILAVLLLLPAPAQAQVKSDYLQHSKKLPSKTFDSTAHRTQKTDYPDRTASGSGKKAGVKRSKKQRRADRHRRAQQKKSEKRFGTFNQ